MKRTILTISLVLVTSICSAALPDEGQSPPSKISKIRSETTNTFFKLVEEPAGCGHPDMWRLPLDGTETNKIKLSLLLTAYAADKTVTLRCENANITDIEIFD